MELSERARESAELLIWECRERYHWLTKEKDLIEAAKCMSFAKVLLGIATEEVRGAVQ